MICAANCDLAETVNADLHNHIQPRSAWKEGEFNSVVDIASATMGDGAILGIAGFNDARFQEFSSLEGYDRKFFDNAVHVWRQNIWFVNGLEVPLIIGGKEHHLLVVGLPTGEIITPYQSIDDTIKDARTYNGVLIGVHIFEPYGLGYFLQSHQAYLGEIDGIEVHNGEVFWPNSLRPWQTPNKMAQEFYDRFKDAYPKLAPSVSSDGHSQAEIGTSYKQFPQPGQIESSGDLVSYLKEAMIQSRELGNKRTNC